MTGLRRTWIIAAILVATLAAACAPLRETAGHGTATPVAGYVPEKEGGTAPSTQADPVQPDAFKPADPYSSTPETNEPESGDTEADGEDDLSRFPEERVTLMAVGDIMVHDQQLEAYRDGQTGSYDFMPSFVHVKPIFQEADWVIGNLETTLAGSEARYSGYPMFNSPESLAVALKEIGMTAVTTANNHSLDRREQGVLKTIDHLDELGILHTGTFASAQARDEPLLLQKGGITLALLSYTYGTNGIPIPEGKSYLVNLIDPALIKQDIEQARQKGADLVAVALHFGNEYERLPSAMQKQTAELCLQFGADIILGSHPHVVQPYEWKTVTREDGTEHTGFVAYSLGNFISAQRWDYKDVGVILKLELLKAGKGEVVIENVELIPTYVYFYRSSGKRNYVIHPVPHTLEKWRSGETVPHLSREALEYMQKLAEEIPAHVEPVVIEEQQKAS
ncbi:CapA family protein [Brevibacillus sp. TJ4]|uniref:CapA family protein n=1 Tax=Brevibacillus sp. TJ4 TaxID=3234853 RepID=UPI0037CE0F0C